MCVWVFIQIYIYMSRRLSSSEGPMKSPLVVVEGVADHGEVPSSCQEDKKSLWLTSLLFLCRVDKPLLLISLQSSKTAAAVTFT